MNMNNPKIKLLRKPKTPTSIGRWLALLTAAVALAHSSVRADDATPPSKVHALVNFEFSDKYLTPRGMIVQDSGLVFQPLVLGFANVYADKDSFINSATIVGGIWNCFGSGRLASSDSGGTDKTSWYE